MGDVFVSTGWLAENLGTVTVLDVRDAWEYEGIGHVPGAVNVPFESVRADEHGVHGEGRGMLPGAERFAAVLGGAGVTREDAVVAYDDTHGVFAARLLVTAELYGHPRERLHPLDGDYSAWTREHETSTAQPAVDPATYRTDEPDGSVLVGRDAVEAAIDGDAVLVDTREPGEYEAGHLPGAVQLDWMELVDEETRGLRPRGELREHLAAAGITPDRRVILYCNTARRISHTYLVLRELGYEDLGFYEGSLTEWEAVGGRLEEGP